MASLQLLDAIILTESRTGDLRRLLLTVKSLVRGTGT